MATMDNNSSDSGLNTPPKHDPVADEKGLDRKHEDVVGPDLGASVPGISPEREKQLLRKLDIRIIPIICWVYLMNFMDRVGIGNARLYGIEDELGMQGNQFQLAVSILFVTYCLCEPPSNLIIKKMKPARYLAGLAFFWGIVATFTSFVDSFGALIACRLLLGVFEAGLFPGVIIYLSMFYNRKSVALRNAYFYGMSAISGGIGGLVAYGIGELNGVGGWLGWRWIFCINGIPTVLTAPFILWLLPNSPDTASFLSEDERRDMMLLRTGEVGQTLSGQHMHKPDVIAAAKDWKTWAFAIAQFIGLSMLYSFSVFLPTVLAGLNDNWSSQVVQALTIPVYFSGAGVYMLTAWWSDRIQQRGIFCIVGFAVSMVGYIFLIINQSLGLSFAGTFFVAFGLWTSTGAAFSWIVVNNPRYGKRALASGLQIGLGNSAGVAAPFLYSSDDAPTYFAGYGATIGMLSVGICLFTALHFYYRMQNKKKLAGKEDWRIEGLTEEEANELGEYNPKYLYTI